MSIPSSSPSSQQAPVVDLGYAKYRGLIDLETNTLCYLGIRYAAPPTGDLRWRAPQPPTTVAEIQDATSHPYKSQQVVMGEDPLSSGMSEDCLFLNLHAPMTVTKPLPVCVWFHGGGYKWGEGSTYNGSHLVAHSGHKIISVIVQYRLGLYGFLAGQEVKENGALNAGLLDQEFALKWVQRHIRNFGGDPDNVTIWGQSAGAGSVLQHLIAHDGKTNPPLFKKAIANSIYLPPQYRWDDEVPQSVYDKVVRRCGIPSEGDTLSALRAVDAATLANANNEILPKGNDLFIFVPVVDGEFIMQSPVQALKEKKVNPISKLLIMHNSDEAAVYIPPYLGTKFTPESYTKLYLFPQLPKETLDKALALYENIGLSNYEKLTSIRSDFLFACPSYILLKAYEGKEDTKEYKAYFAVPPGLHGQELPYFFLGLAMPGYASLPTLDDPDFAKALVQPFMSLIKSAGDDSFTLFNTDCDSLPLLPKWEPYAANHSEMHYGVTNEGTPEVKIIKTDERLLERIRFWESIAALSGQ